MEWMFVLGLAIASSVDNLGVGMSYGIRKIRIGVLSNTWIAVICFLFSMGGILAGRWISAILPGILPVILGAFLLFIIGLRIILLAIPRPAGHQPAADRGQPRPGKMSRMGAKKGTTKKLGGLSGLLQNPERADLDRSGAIGFWESMLLGVALSANALTNGVGAGMLGFPPLAISASAAIGSFVTVWLGVYLGRKLSDVRIGSFSVGQFGTLISGLLLLIIAAGAFL